MGLFGAFGPCCGQITCPVSPVYATFGDDSWYAGVPTSTGLILTAQPRVVTDPSWIAEYEVGLSSNRHILRRLNVVHQTRHALLGDLQADGRTWRPVEVAASQVGCGQFLSTAGETVVWFQVVYRPTDNLDGDEQRGGFALVRIYGAVNTLGAAPERRFDLLEAWLANDAAGDPMQWDAESKLCDYTSHGLDCRRVCTGEAMFCFEDRRLDGGVNNRLTYWSPGQADPTVATWTNPEWSESHPDWSLAILSRHNAPYGLHAKVERTTHPDGSIASVDRQYRAGICQLDAQMRIAATDEGGPHPSHPVSDAGVPLTSCSRDVSDAPFNDADTRVYIGDWAGYGQRFPSFQLGSQLVFPFYNPALGDDGGGPIVDNNDTRLWSGTAVLSAPIDGVVLSGSGDQLGWSGGASSATYSRAYAWIVGAVREVSSGSISPQATGDVADPWDFAEAGCPVRAYATYFNSAEPSVARVSRGFYFGSQASGIVEDIPTLDDYPGRANPGFDEWQRHGTDAGEDDLLRVSVAIAGIDSHAGMAYELDGVDPGVAWQKRAAVVGWTDQISDSAVFDPNRRGPRPATALDELPADYVGDDGTAPDALPWNTVARPGQLAPSDTLRTASSWEVTDSERRVAAYSQPGGPLAELLPQVTPRGFWCDDTKWSGTQQLRWRESGRVAYDPLVALPTWPE